MPSAAQMIIDRSSTISTETGQGSATSMGASSLFKYRPAKAPSMKTSPCAKLMNRSTPYTIV